ncbi:three-Cys-motif partner protein TcmP [Gordonia polyisoprenivorans]|uniref:three-Cys-motif partner protein TcmP n=1 Tax=Gordonia polyisoprenivorans TaxID=84595 RepID=UPI001AD687F5|nr:three-Cys-motif partner protein TcmP [Gordonia polyisoprenivorans]QTI67388.1 three-Cys-motif partner protein TcmP [Gordonia polyisoprenivorans]
MGRRGWGPWSKIKLEALSDYLGAFTRASQVASHTLYLDLFAGAPDNFERGTGNVILGSGHRALSTEPKFDRVVLCELQPRTAATLRRDLQQAHPGRDLVVLPGDCNVVIPRHLDSYDYSWRRGAAVFAMVDQFSAEIRWETLRYLANWRKNKRGFKVELWLYFGHGLLPRGLQFTGDEPDPEYAERVDRMFDTDQWRELWYARKDGVINAETFRAELVNLMRWRLERELGYSTTIPLEFTNTSGHPIYTVIFATANATGDKIMTSVFAKHGVALDKMRTAAKIERRIAKDDDEGLFGAETIVELAMKEPVREPLAPPVEPFRYHRDG